MIYLQLWLYLAGVVINGYEDDLSQLRHLYILTWILKVINLTFELFKATYELVFPKI